MSSSNLLVLSGYVVILAFVFIKFNSVQPDPYMDEIFHVPQAQNYCHNNYNHWNPKITTLPGLYLVSLGILHIAALASGNAVTDLCTVLNLRLTNALLIISCLPICYGILLQSSMKLSKSRSAFHSSMVVCLFPLLYFNSFTYYTDVGSTLFVLAMYLSSLHGKHVLAALLGTFAIVFRQTNVVWLCFAAGTAAYEFAVRERVFECKSPKIMEYMLLVISRLISHSRNLVLILSPYLMGTTLFLVFVYKNGGIVVGDKSSHHACLNIPQLFYFFAFSMAFSFPMLLRYIRDKDMNRSLRSCIRNPNNQLLFGLLGLLGFIMVGKFTYVHEYLISDNRHYTFYIWKRIFEQHWTVRFALVPVYILCGSAMIHMLSLSQSMIWIVMYVICSTAVIVPQKLLEFRYFIVPYVMYRLHLKVTSKLELVLELVLYSVVNVWTLYVFMHRPFYWAHEPNLQRFMW